MANERQRGNPPGPTSETVALNIARVRRHRGLTLRGLSAALTEVGWPISWSALGKIENHARKVDVDDLTAIAVALDVSPLGLLLPRAARSDDPVNLTGLQRPAALAWLWGLGWSSTWDEEVSMSRRLVDQDDIYDVSLPRWLDIAPSVRPVGPDQTLSEAKPRVFPFTRVESSDG